jgi:hypothetical protein
MSAVLAQAAAAGMEAWVQVLIAIATAVVVALIVGVFGWVIKRAIEASEGRIGDRVSRVESRIGKIEEKADRWPAEIAAVHARVSDTNEVVAGLKVAVDAKRR